MNPQFPVYIISKGRAESRLTARALDRCHIPFHIIVEEQEFDEYAAVIPSERVLILPQKYKEDYELLDEHGLTKSTGPGPARNFAWDHSIERGADWHWVLDDNIRGWFRYHQNRQIPLGDGTMWRACEDFVLRYKNVAVAGPHYDFFVLRKEKHEPFIVNSRIYSQLLIRNDIPFRWRGRYNEDTILCLDVLKAGWCTILFRVMLQKKLPTQKIGGGNTEEFYAKEGTALKSEILKKVYPELTRLVIRWGRQHHYIDYRQFNKTNRLKRRRDIEIPTGVNEYGMELVKRRR